MRLERVERIWKEYEEHQAQTIAYANTLPQEERLRVLQVMWMCEDTGLGPQKPFWPDYVVSFCEEIWKKVRHG